MAPAAALAAPGPPSTIPGTPPVAVAPRRSRESMRDQNGTV